MAVIRKISPPNLPQAPAQYSSLFEEQYSNILRLFFNQLTNLVNAATPYGSFYDTSNQTNPVANQKQTMHLSTTASAYKTSVVDGTTTNARVYVTESGIYNIQFSAQVYKGSGGTADVYFWLLQNGATVEDSAGFCTVAGGAGATTITAWNYVIPMQKGDYIQLAWTSPDTSIQLKTIGATTPIPGTYIPASPSLIFTINWISSIPL